MEESLKKAKRISPDKEVEIHALALSRFDDIQATVWDERQQCLEDRRFYSIAGAQWEGDLGEQYENKPKFEVNKVHLHIIRIINEYRANRMTVDFLPQKDTDDKLADLCGDLFRADEKDSNAQEAYDNAFEEAVGGGFGAWRLRADYEDEYDEENDYQRIKIEPIYDADVTVFFDPDSKFQDKSDARYAFILNAMTEEAYMEKYDDDPSTWPKAISDFDWTQGDSVYVAEYFLVEEAKETLVYFENVLGEEEKHWLKDVEDQMEEMAKVGTIEKRRRKIKQRKIHKYVMSGSGILEDCGYLPGKEIPIVPVFGKRWVIENVERCMGHVRLSKDAQRLKNMQLSKLGEISALSSVEKPILTPDQIAGHQQMWAEDNIKDYPYLLINPIVNEEGQIMPSAPVAYTRSSAIPPAMAALLQITEQDMLDLSGNANKGDQLLSHTSASALESIQERTDALHDIYMTNMKKAMVRCGQIYLSIAKEIYIEDERDIKVINKEGGASRKKIMVKTINEKGDLEMQGNIADALFDVNVSVGPSSASKRAAIVRSLTQMMGFTQDPETLTILSSMSIMNLEGDGMQDLREFFRKKLVTMGALEPNEQDLKRIQETANQPPSPNDQYLLAAAEKEKSIAEKNKADIVQTLADSELKKAQATKLMVEAQQIPISAVQQAQANQSIQPQAQPKDYREEELLLKAKETSMALKLKEREIAIKERELEMKLAEAGAVIDTSEDGKASVKNGHEVLANTLAEKISEAMKGLQESIKEQKATLESTSKAQIAQAKDAIKILQKPRKVVRENGRVVGIESV